MSQSSIQLQLLWNSACEGLKKVITYKVRYNSPERQLFDQFLMAGLRNLARSIIKRLLAIGAFIRGFPVGLLTFTRLRKSLLFLHYFHQAVLRLLHFGSRRLSESDHRSTLPGRLILNYSNIQRFLHWDNQCNFNDLVYIGPHLTCFDQSLS